ncbi:MAG: helix-turn-helix domain-containing protein [Candidatus Coproplasma sp.]
MLNEKIKELRSSFGISQVELAKQLGVSKQCVSNWENDNVQPSVEMLVQIARYFNVSTDYLLGLDCKETIDVSGLSEAQKAHVKLIVKDLTKE